MPRSRLHAPWNPAEPLEPRTMLAAVSWDGGGGDLSWHNPLNWSSDALPTATDDVVIDIPGPQPTITLSQPGTTSVHSLVCNEGLSLSAGALALGGDWHQNGPLALTGGDVTGSGNLVLNHLNALWSAGQLSGSGRVQLLPGSRLRIAGDVTLARTLVNNAALVWDSGNIACSSASIYNLAGRTFDARSPGSISGPASTLINSGTLNCSGTAATITTLAIAVNSTGIIDVRQGRLIVTGTVAQIVGSTLTAGDWRLSDPSSRLHLSGPSLTAIGPAAAVSFNAAGALFPKLATLALNSGRLTFVGNHNLDFTPAGGTFTNAAGATFTRSGPGITQASASLRVVNAGAVVIQGGALVLSGGLFTNGGTITITAGSSLTLNGGTATFNNTSIFGGGFFLISTWTTWNSGAWWGPGTTSIGASGTLALASPALKTLGRATTSNGSIWWAAGPWQLGAITVNNTGLATLSAGAELSTTGGQSILSNSGTLRKTGAGTITLSSLNGGVRLSNTGTVAIQQGQLVLAGGGGSGGVFTIAALSGLTYAGLAATLSGASFSGAGSLTIANALTWSGGSILGPGAMTITALGALSLVAGVTTLSRSLVNNGTLAWSGGSLNVGPVTISSFGTTNLSAGASAVTPSGAATFRNFGTVNKTGLATTSFLIADITFDNRGTVNVTGGELALNGARVSQISGAALTAGTWNVTNASLRFVGSTLTTNAATVRLSGFSAQIPSLGTFNHNSGTLEVTDGCQLTLIPAGGALVNSGTFTLGPAVNIHIFGALQFTSTSVFNVIVSGPIPLSDHGRIEADGGITAGGALIARFTNGYDPAPGAMFDFLSTATGAGAFSTTSAVGLSAGKTVQFAFTGSAGRLTVVPA